MRIAYDATTLRPWQTGIGYYSEHLLRHLLEAAQDCKFQLISNRKIETSLPLGREVPLVEEGRFPLRSVWMQTTAPRLLSRLKPDLAHFTNSVSPLRKTVPTVLTVHDMSLKMLPALHPFRRRLFGPLHRASLQRADAVITVSESAKQDILHHSSLSPKRVHVIYEAASPEFRPFHDRPALETLRRRLGLGRRILLFVGTIEPHKNLVGLINAYHLLRQNDHIPHQLVLAGIPGWGYREVTQRIAQLGLEREILLTGYLPYQDLPLLYNLAEIFAFPSFHEGFGLPVLEAMSCGVPAVVSNHSSLVEITGKAAVQVDPRDVQSLAAGLKQLIDSREAREHFARLGLERAATFSWEKAASQTLEIYRHVARTSPCQPA